MQRLRNQVTIVGNIDDRARITRFGNGSLVARFSVSVKKEHVRGDEHPDSFFRMFAWGNTAQFIEQYCGKGNTVAVSGKLVNRTYMSPDGQPRKITEIEVRQLVRL